ncbi:MAG: hypothetical protein KAS18_10505 [Calditrichia bacterium]|nr:hypothetical protein [Calditrichia bacterium]
MRFIIPEIEIILAKYQTACSIITKAVAINIATTQYHVFKIFLSLCLANNDSKIVAINGGTARDK